MFELLIGILVMAAVVYTGFDILNRIYTRETATDLDKWEADHADILTTKQMGRKEQSDANPSKSEQNDITSSFAECCGNRRKG